MSNRQNNNIAAQVIAPRYVRQNSNAGVNPLCDKLRSQYGIRFETAVNRSVVRREELIREARRNGWSRPRRPAPTYSVRNALRSPEPGVPASAMEKNNFYAPAARAPRPIAVGAVGAVGTAGGSQAPAQRQGVTSMTRVASGDTTRRTTLETIGDMITGRSLARTDERKVQKKDFPVGAIFAVIICALLFMLVVYCSMQKSVVQSDVFALEGQVAELEATAQGLSLDLEMKDDLREIEQIATEQIGMVKKESAQTKYVSAGGTEKNLVLGTDEEASGGFSGILSVFGNQLGRIVEYIN